MLKLLMKVAGLFPILVAGQAGEGISEPIKNQEWIWKGDPVYYEEDPEKRASG
jgi:hypothetical protein